MRKAYFILVLLLAVTVGAGPAAAGEARQGGKLLLTGGVSNIEGASGGGLTSWALIDGDETDDGIGGSGHVTFVALPDFDLMSYGLAIGVHDRIEVSYAHQSLDTRAAGAALGLGRGFVLSQDVFGAKVRVLGDAIYAQDSILPQIAIGVQHKRAAQSAVLRAVGAGAASGTDVYVSATKLILSQSLILNATIRATKANQTGLLGFGGDARRGYSAQVEGAAGVLLSRHLVFGGEFRARPDNLGFAREADAYDVFLAYAALRNVSLTAAYVDLGPIATIERQRGAYLSLRANF